MSLMHAWRPDDYVALVNLGKGCVHRSTLARVANNRIRLMLLEYEGIIPKLRNHDSCYPALCRDGRIVNVSQIKHLDGRYKPAATSQMGRG
jgi:hypothetical protein